MTPFDCALSGPFDSLFLAGLSAPPVLCKVITAVISASTVYYLLVRIISLLAFFVNSKILIFLLLFTNALTICIKYYYCFIQNSEISELLLISSLIWKQLTVILCFNQKIGLKN